MASAVRSLCRLAGGVSAVALRSRAAAMVRPRLRYASAAISFSSSWKVNHSKLHPLSVVPRRGYAEELSSQELSDRVLHVLKTFDKIEPTKVNKE